MSTEQLTPECKKGLAVCSAVITPLFYSGVHLLAALIGTVKQV